MCDTRSSSKQPMAAHADILGATYRMYTAIRHRLDKYKHIELREGKPYASDTHTRGSFVCSEICGRRRCLWTGRFNFATQLKYTMLNERDTHNLFEQLLEISNLLLFH